jgi:hypothetical protein
LIFICFIPTKCRNLKKQHFIILRCPQTPPPPPRHGEGCVMLVTADRNNVELQIKNSRQNMAFSVTSILPLQSSIYRDHKSLNL